MKKRFLSVILLLSVIFCFAFPFSAASDYDNYRISDHAGFLNDSDSSDVRKLLNGFSDEYGVECFVYTESVGYEVSESMADATCDEIYEAIFGHTAKQTVEDCVILYVVDDSLEEDYAYIATWGKGHAIINDDAVSHIISDVLAGKSDDKSGRIVDFAEELGVLFSDYEESGEPYKEPFSFGVSLIIALAAGFLISLVVVLIMKGKLKSVHMKYDADDYTVPDSMNITDERDLFLYSSVVVTPKPKNNDSSSGGSSSSHGGGGGRI